MGGGGGGWGVGAYNRIKTCFENKLHGIADQNTFEFDRFFQFQNVVESRIHFNTS